MTSIQPLDTAVTNRKHFRSISAIVEVICSWLIGLALLAAAAYLTSGLTFERSSVAAVLTCCFLLQLFVPAAWLVYLPFLLPVADLSLWSGRLYVSEFDLLVLVTVAAHFLRAPPSYRFPHMRRLDGWAIVLFFVFWFIVAAIEGATPLKALSANELGDYLSHYNALRVVKSAIEALLLLGALQWRFAAAADQLKTLLILGISLGLGLTGIIVCWERGVFLAVAQSPGFFAGRYAIANALLDFTTSYRATALFSELSTGGEAIDTYLCLALPVAVAGAFTLRQPAYRLICLIAYALGTYATVATFSRGLYGGYATGLLAVLFFIALGFRRHGGMSPKSSILRAGLAAILSLSALVLAYNHGGWTALGVGLILGAMCFAAALSLHDSGQKLGLLVFPVFTLIGVWGFLHAFNSSHYVRTDSITAAFLAATCGGLLAIAGALVSGPVVASGARVSAAMAYMLFAAIAAIAVPATGGYRMVERLSTASSDADTRSGHWREALRLMGRGWQDYAFGMGLGSFPRLYFREGQEGEGKASYRYRKDDAGTWLEIGTGDFNLTQKLPIKPGRHYEMNLAIRGQVPKAGVDVNFCPKLILFSDRYTPDCHEFSFAVVVPGQWEKHRVSFDSGTLGQDAPFSWPPTFMLHNSSDTASIDVTAIHVTQDGQEVLSNGDFLMAGDRWMMISDFEHLAWHIKNLYVELFFETGVIGLAAFALTMAFALIIAFKLARKRDPIGVAAGGAIVSFLTVGAVGSLFDNPRPAILFFLLLFTLLQKAGPKHRFS